MYKVDIPINDKESAALERQKNLELQRQSRIFNPRVRTIGVDVTALDQQVQERKQREEEERNRDIAFDELRILEAQALKELEIKEELNKKELEKDIVKFRNTFQRREDGRDFDLNDFRGHHMEPPARISDTDPRCGPSGLQIFEGEDLREKIRTKVQKEENERILSLQKENNEWKKAAQKYADHMSDRKLIDLDMRALHLSQLEEEFKKAINMSLADYNKALAQESSERQRIENEKEQEINLMDIWGQLTSDLLTENPEAARQSLWGHHRILVDRWKGMSPEEREEIERQRREQVAEKKRLNAEANESAAEWDRQSVLVTTIGEQLQKKQEEKVKELRGKLDRYNQQLAREQQSHQRFLDKELYKNEPTAQYFAQFNTTSR